MKRMFAWLAAAASIAGPAVVPSPVLAQDAKPARQPNFLIIVADDLGFSDIGAFGGEIATPNLDGLAKRGLKLTGFHTAPTCSPTRSSLLTGLDHHEAGVGNMAELLTPNQRGKPHYEGTLRPDTATLAEILSSAGYRTHFSGKWHLGVTPEQDPHRRGFQSSFSMLAGAHNHFGRDVGQQAERGRLYSENGKQVNSLPADFYSSNYFSEHLARQLKTAKAGADGGKPFFAYLAFSAPHFPLQAPPAEIAKYKGRYDAGYEALRDARLKRQAALGLVDPKVAAHPFQLARKWSALTPEQKAVDARRMEVFAAMVDRMDQGIGKVLQSLRETGELDNTVVVFLADNGAEGSYMFEPSMGMLNKVYAAADNRIDNIGAANSYESIGSGWAEAATAPAWRVKGYETEGGTRVVSFIAGPGVKPGIGRAYTHVADVTPTLLDLAHVSPPRGTLSGRAVQPIRGRSWAGWLQGKASQVYPADQAVGDELFGGRNLRQGDWKLVDIGDGTWRLFDLATDPGENRDLAAAQPERVAALAKAWDRYASDVGVIMPDKPMAILQRPAQQ